MCTHIVGHVTVEFDDNLSRIIPKWDPNLLQQVRARR